MTIEAENFKIELKERELWTLACWVREALKTTIREHWARHQQAYLQHEKERLDMLKYMFGALNRLDMYNEIEGYAKDAFEAFNKEKTKS